MLKRKLITLLFALLSVMAVSGSVTAGEGVKGTAKADSLDQCVAETPFMRRNHMELILHQRDITVHDGVRLTDNSLSGCVDCHARKDKDGHFVPVNTEGQFCSSCHVKTAVSMDCFSCHRTVPAGDL